MRFQGREGYHQDKFGYSEKATKFGLKGGRRLFFSGKKSKEREQGLKPDGQPGIRSRGKGRLMTGRILSTAKVESIQKLSFKLQIQM